MEIKMVLTRLNSEELVAFNPNLSEIAPLARRAYAKFKAALENYNDQYEKDNRLAVKGPPVIEKSPRTRESIRKMIIERAKSIDSTGSIQSLVADLEKMIDKDERSKTDHEKDSKTEEENEKKKTVVEDNKKKEDDKQDKTTKDGEQKDEKKAKDQTEENVKKEEEKKEEIKCEVEVNMTEKQYDNKGFVSEEPKLILTPPSHQGSICADGEPEHSSLSRTASPRPASSPASPRTSAAGTTHIKKEETPKHSPAKVATVEKTVKQPTHKSTPGPSPRLTPKPTSGPTPGPSPGRTPKQTLETSSGPTPGPSPGHTPKPTPEPTSGPTPGPSPGLTPKRTPEPAFGPVQTPGPSPRPTPEPTPGPSARPTPKPTPQPTPGTSPKLDPKLLAGPSSSAAKLTPAASP